MYVMLAHRYCTLHVRKCCHNQLHNAVAIMSLSVTIGLESCWSALLKLSTHCPCPRAVFTGRVHVFTAVCTELKDRVHSNATELIGPKLN